MYIKIMFIELMCESFILKMYNFNNHRLIYVMKILEKEQF
jgi:hypothetical protein